MMSHNDSCSDAVNLTDATQSVKCTSSSFLCLHCLMNGGASIELQAGVLGHMFQFIDD